MGENFFKMTFGTKKGTKKTFLFEDKIFTNRKFYDIVVLLYCF